MTPLDIMDDEIQTKCIALKMHHASFRNALFRPEETASPLVKEFNIGQHIRVLSAKQLTQRVIEDIRYLRRIRERMSFAERCRGEKERYDTW